MNLLVIFLAYLVYTTFWIRFISHAFLWWRASGRFPGHEPPHNKPGFRTYLQGVGDILLFRRLFNVNRPIWFGEWLFHLSFVLVALRHLRFFMDPVPGWVWSLQTPGLISGYLLALSLVYIVIVRILFANEQYNAASNLFLLFLLLLISLSGIVMNLSFKSDIVDIKAFIMSLLTLKPVRLPGNPLFVVHFLLFLILVPCLPSHIFAAPVIMMEARKREDGLDVVMHHE